MGKLYNQHLRSFVMIITKRFQLNKIPESYSTIFSHSYNLQHKKSVAQQQRFSIYHRNY